MDRSRKRGKKHTRQVPSTTKGRNLDQTSKERRTKRNFRNRIEPEKEEEDSANCAKPQTRTNNTQTVVCSRASTTSKPQSPPPAKPHFNKLARSLRAPF
jgi:hypothetical protein